MKEQDLVNFINWLIESKEAPEGSSFEETVSWINELSTSEDGKQMLNQLLNTYKKSNNMEFFKKGGKFDYLLCLKKGGNIQDCGCGKKIEKAQDGATVETIKKTYTEIPGTDIDGNTYFEPYVEYHTPNGTVTQVGKSYRSNYGLGQYLPSLPFGPAKWQHNKAERQYNRQELNKSHQRNQELLQARNLEVQQKYGPVGNEAPMMADGGEISRQDVINQYPYASKQDVIKAMNQAGLNNKEARQAYRNSKREMRDLGLRGRGLRQAARYNLIDQVYPRAGMTEEEARRAMLDNMITKISYD